MDSRTATPTTESKLVYTGESTKIYRIPKKPNKNNEKSKIIDSLINDDDDDECSICSLGSYSMEYDEEGKYMAVKVLTNRNNDSNTVDKSTFYNEYNILNNQLSRIPNVTRVIEKDTDRDAIYLQWVKGMTLEKYLEKHHRSWTDKKLKKETVLTRTKIVYEIVKTLRTIHEAGVIHNDISADNIMVDISYNINIDDEKEEDVDVTIVDFGHASYAQNGEVMDGEGGFRANDDLHALTVLIHDVFSVDSEKKSLSFYDDKNDSTNIFGVDLSMSASSFTSLNNIFTPKSVDNNSSDNDDHVHHDQGGSSSRLPRMLPWTLRRLMCDLVTEDTTSSTGMDFNQTTSKSNIPKPYQTLRELEDDLYQIINQPDIYLFDPEEQFATANGAFGSLPALASNRMDRHSLNNFLSERLRLTKRNTKSLSDIIHRKTLGNSYFANEFLFSMCDQNIFTFSLESVRWIWTDSEVEEQGISDDVAELMCDTIGSFNDDCRNVLKISSCIGSYFEASVVNLVWDVMTQSDLIHPQVTAPEYVDRILQHLAQVGVIVKMKIGDDHYRFSHNLVHQTTYSLMSNDEKSSLHLRTGRILLQRMTPSECETLPLHACHANIASSSSSLFEVTDQLNRGVDHMEDKKEISQLINLNMKSGEKAMHSRVFSLAETYLLTALDLLEHSDAMKLLGEKQKQQRERQPQQHKHTLHQHTNWMGHCDVTLKLHYLLVMVRLGYEVQ